MSFYKAVRLFWGGYAITALLLVAVIVAAVALRAHYVLNYGDAPAWSVMVLENGNLALNILHGRGYVTTISPELNEAVESANRIIPIQVVQQYAPGAPRVPSPYYLPGYPYLVAILWTITGEVSYTIPQLFQSLVDGVIGPLAIFGLLATTGRVRAGLIAAGLYATAVPVIDLSRRVLPDSLTSVTTLAVIAALVVGFHRGRPYWGASVAGVLLGLGGWLRADFIVLLPLLVLVIFVTQREREREYAIVFLSVAYLVPSILLVLWFTVVYGEFHITRPGTGLMLWEAIGQQPNPWGIEPPPGGSLDTAAGMLLAQNGLRYGTWQGDAFLLSRAIQHIGENPTWFINPIVNRVLRVITIDPNLLWFNIRLDLQMIKWQLLNIHVILPLAVLGWFCMRKWPLLAGVLLAVWLSRVIPFAFLRDEPRFVIALVPMYIMGASFFLDWAFVNLYPHLLTRLFPSKQRETNLSGWGRQ